MGSSRIEQTSRWPFRWAAAAAVSAVPLVLFGGSVTTIGAGMAVDGWLVAEGHFLLFFPAEKWFRDTATFVEHSHRLFGVLVGAFSLLALGATLFRDRRGSAKLMALGATLLVALQGLLGGLRVLADDSRVAFLHGAFAQAVFAFLCATACFLSPGWIGGAGRLHESSASARGLALWTTVAIYVELVLGACYRHAIRPSIQAEAPLWFLVHALGALVVLVLLGRLLALLSRFDGDATIARALKRIGFLLGAQIVLGFLAWISRRPGAIGPVEWGLSVAHVLGGGLLLSQTAVTWMRLARGRARAVRGELRLQGFEVGEV